jgi:hypothetical protein
MSRKLRRRRRTTGAQRVFFPVFTGLTGRVSLNRRPQVSPEEQAKRDADRKRRQEEEERMCGIVRQEMPPPFTLGQVRSSDARGCGLFEQNTRAAAADE